MNKITFSSADAFHAFVLFAIKNGLAYRADEMTDGSIVVVVTGY